MRSPFQSLVLIAFVALACGLAHADSIDLIYSQPMGTHWAQSQTGGNFFWSNHETASAGNDYHVGNSTGTNLRTPEGTSSTFAGDSLTVHPGGQLLLKANNNSRVFTVNDFRFLGGKLTHGSDNRTITVEGLFSVLADSVIDNAGKNARRLHFDAQLIGEADLDVRLGDDDWMIIGADNSGFSGDWDMVFAPYSGDNGSPMPYVVADAANSLGSGSIYVGDGVRLDLDYDVANLGSSLTVDGLLTLDQDLSFGTVTIGGVPLPCGTHSFEWLNEHFDAYIADGGSGSIYAAPEPSTLALSLLGLAHLALRRRRRA